MKVAAVILAAGQGTRMRSVLPKVLHPLLGEPLITHALRAVQPVCDFPPVIVVGVGAEDVRQVVGNQACFALQEQQLGTAHALQQARSQVDPEADLILVTSGDMPLFRNETLRQVVQTQLNNPGPITMTTLISEEPRGFGRVLRHQDGSTVQAIIEEAQATPEQLAIHELNAAAYCYRADWLWPALERIPISPKGEYYLTDTVGLAVAAGLPVQAVVLQDASEALGINTRVHLAEAEALLRVRINTEWMLSGVTLTDPLRTTIERGVSIGQDCIIWPNSYLQGSTRVGRGCVIGPDTTLRDAQVGDGARIVASIVQGCSVNAQEQVGPYAHLTSQTLTWANPNQRPDA